MHARAPADAVSVGSTHKAPALKLHLATMCGGFAARRRFGVADHALAQVRPRQFFFTGGGVVRLTAKPRYLLLLHRGNEKSNTVTALIVTAACNEQRLCCFFTYVIVCIYICTINILQYTVTTLGGVISHNTRRCYQPQH